MSNRPPGGSAPRGLRGALLAGLLAGVLAPVGLAGPAHAVQDAAEPAAVYEELAPAQQVGQVSFQAHHQLALLGAEEAWEFSTGAGVTVAVLDSGVDGSHPDLAGRVRPGRDYVDSETDGREDPVGHGTTVASLIAGRGEQVIGLAPDATILPIRVLDDENRYDSATTVADGVRWAVRQGAQVINLSLGGARQSPALGEALEYAMAHDVVVIACTGNAADDSDAEVWYPAREPGVVAVSGVRWSEGTLTDWPQSLTGPETVISAPAVVTGAAAGGGYRAAQGTSFASALVAGAAALIRARWPEMPAGEVVNRLVATADDLGEPGRDPVYGFGVINPLAALTEVVSPAPANPLDIKARHATSGFGPAPTAGQELAAPPDPGPDRSDGGRALIADLVQPTPAGSVAPSDDAAILEPSGAAAARAAVPGAQPQPRGALLLAVFAAAVAAALLAWARTARSRPRGS